MPFTLFFSLTLHNYYYIPMFIIHIQTPASKLHQFTIKAKCQIGRLLSFKNVACANVLIMTKTDVIRKIWYYQLNIIQPKVCGISHLQILLYLRAINYQENVDV